MSIYLPNGIGQTLGDSLVTSSPLFTTGEVHYVLSTTGADSANYGESPVKPYATLAHAISQAAAGDIIVLLSGHTEDIGTQVDVSKALVIVGAGQTDGKPTVKFTDTGASGSTFVLSAANVELRNLWFEPHDSAQATPQVDVTGTGCRVIGCYFEANENNNAHSLDINTALISQVKDCTFVSVVESATDLPTGGLNLGSGLLFLENNVFDDGAFGYETFAFRATAASTIRGEGNSFLNGARFSAVESSAQILLAGGTPTGGVQFIEAP